MTTPPPPRPSVKLSERTEKRISLYLETARRRPDALPAFAAQLARTDPTALAFGRAQVAAGTPRKGC